MKILSTVAVVLTSLAPRARADAPSSDQTSKTRVQDDLHNRLSDIVAALSRRGGDRVAESARAQLGPARAAELAERLEELLGPSTTGDEAATSRRARPLARTHEHTSVPLRFGPPRAEAAHSFPCDYQVRPFLYLLRW